MSFDDYYLAIIANSDQSNSAVAMQNVKLIFTNKFTSGGKVIYKAQCTKLKQNVQVTQILYVDISGIVKLYMWQSP